MSDYLIDGENRMLYNVVDTDGNILARNLSKEGATYFVEGLDENTRMTASVHAVLQSGDSVILG